MTGNGDICPKCEAMAMPKLVVNKTSVGETQLQATARRCQACGYIEELECQQNLPNNS